MTDNFADNFQKTRAAVVEMLTDQGATVGAKVEFAGPLMLLGNMAYDDPALSLVAVDDLGRLWKERHHGGSHSLECIFDLRSLGPLNEGEDHADEV